ncbi:NUDIX domain-containing protein [Hirsutella rhossiliensis]|uniref:NUDIX domain-containing protein n=1 Tax=Hirsutella rhossiliensis TaxID=111463 RepID=A0A9P8MW92_9HYPO|nr:NUDIX domain-containing protein [Hirsutella rhossiliensis]KAH0960327.1 NUDIX domain-containing protein [Hirsutella rhossiliensis]
MKSNIELIDVVDKFPYSEVAAGNAAEAELAQHGLWSLLWEDEQGRYPIGYMLDRVVRELEQVPVSVRGDVGLNRTDRTVLLFQLPTEQERSRVVAALADHWRNKGTFKLLRGWRDEVWPVYSRTGELLFSMERAAMGLLGTMRYGVHLTAYVVDAAAPHGLKLWVPKRATDKSTFPGMLDNTVAGGLMTGEDPFECVIREADEEASLPDHLVRRQARCVGTVTYMYITDEKQVGEGGFVYPECQWVYDLELPADVTPQPKDGEVEEFYLCDIDEVKEALAQGKFKHNCALVVLDFFIRHGILTEDNEAEFAAIRRRMHRELPFPGPHQTNWHPA